MTRTSWIELIQKEYGGKLPSLKKIKSYITGIKDKETQIFCILSFFSAGRISEITYKNDRKYKLLAKRNRKKVALKDKEGKTIYEKVLNKNYDAKPKTGIRQKDITVEEVGDKFYLRISMRNNKNRTNHYKTTVAPVHMEKELSKILIDYIKPMKPEEQIIKKSRTTLWAKVKKFAPLFFYPHFIRSLRIGILYNVYNFNEQEVINFAGWTDGRPGASYNVFRNPSQFIDKMSKIEEVVK